MVAVVGVPTTLNWEFPYLVPVAVEARLDHEFGFVGDLEGERERQ